MRSYWIFILVVVSVIGPSLGVAVGSVNGYLQLGLGIGVALAIIVGLLANFKWDLWLFVVAMATIFLIFAFQPVLLGLAYLICGVALGVATTSLILRLLQEKDLFAEAEVLYDSRLVDSKPGHLIESPNSISMDETPKVIGPANLIVDPNAVVVLENSGRQTAIIGPGTTQTEPYEYVRAVYSLQPQYIQLQFVKVITQDVLFTTVRIGLTYAIDVAWEARQGLRPLLPNERYAIQAFHIRALNWEGEFAAVCESSVRSIISGYSLSEVISGAYYPIIEAGIAKGVQKSTSEWGITLHRVQLIEVQVSEENSIVHNHNGSIRKNKLSGRQQEQLQDVLLAAFNEQSLEQMARMKMDVNLKAVAGGMNMGDIVFNFVDWAQRNGRISDLIHAAAASVPSNTELKALSDSWQDSD